jgi:hypothetical protein
MIAMHQNVLAFDTAFAGCAFADCERGRIYAPIRSVAAWFAI